MEKIQKILFYWLKKNCIPLELIVNKFVDKDSWKPIGSTCIGNAVWSEICEFAIFLAYSDIVRPVGRGEKE